MLSRTGMMIAAAMGALNHGILGRPTDSVSAVPVATTIQKFQVSDVHPSYALPVTAKASTVRDCPVMEVLAWNAMGGLSMANGGAETARDSLVSKYTGGGCLRLVRQDDYGQMEANLAKFVQSNGTQGVAIMGDGYPYVAAAMNKLIPGQFAAVGVVGFSDGEDQCMVPGEAAADKQKLKGVLIAAVPRDGDWNICVKLASDNGIAINVNQKTYDPTAMNFVDVDSFVAADEKLIGHACEDRLVVENGLSHGNKRVCVNGVATWTPGDVDVVSKFNGSIVGAASTHDYQGQMPALIIGSKTWMAAHRDYVVGLLKAADRGAMAVRSGPAGLLQMGAIHTQIFKEQDAAYWAKYFKGSTGTNHAGENVPLGGSKVITLQEARDTSGCGPARPTSTSRCTACSRAMTRRSTPACTPRVATALSRPTPTWWTPRT
jgi:OOP family OmpA-OmpF porin